MNSTKFIGTGEINVQITINATGTPTVVATTAAGAGTVGQTFTANAAGIAQVDVWDAYTPTDDPFVTGTLDFQATTSTITAAITAATAGDTLIVHADTYAEILAINQDITLQSLSGATATIIDVSAAQNTNDEVGSIGIDVTVAGVTITGFTIIGVPTVTDSTATGFTISSGAYPTIKGSIASGPLNLIVQDNIFTVPSGKVGHSALLVLPTPSASADISAVKFLDNEVTNYVNGVTGRMDDNTKAHGVNDLLVEGNTFNQSSYLEDPDYYGVTFYLAKGVQLWEGTNLKVIDNTFTGPATLAGEFDTDDFKDIFAIQDVGDSHGGTGSQSVTYTGNTITNYFAGIFTWSGGIIKENDISATTVGIKVGQRRANSAGETTIALTISENNITNSLNRGIWVQNTGSNDVTVEYNTIAGNANYGLTNEMVSGTATAGSTTTLTDTSLEWDFVARGVLAGDRVVNVTTGLTATVASGGIAAYTLTLDNPDTGFTFSAGDSYRVEAKVDVDSARYNWWGAIGGPSADAGETAPLGNGDVLSSKMDTSLADTVYDPWLTETQAIVITDGIRSYGSDAIALEEGWNTLSVPSGLKGTGDTFGDIQAMGDYLTDFVGGYWYNASTSMWVGIDSTTTLEPGKGFYIQMSAASTFPVLYFDGSLHLPTYDLYAGWNLIGSMFGIDKTAGGDATDAGDYGVATAGTGTETEDEKDVAVALASIWASSSVIVSPSMPGQLAEWATTITGEDMYVGEAYWVFMTTPAILAGFEVTPFYFSP